MATNSKAASTISSIPDSRKLPDAVNSMDTRSLEVFTQQVIQLLAHRKSAGNLSETEALLLKEIYTLIPERAQSRFSELSFKSEESDLTNEEHLELLALIELLEEKYAKRLEKLIELARLKSMRLEDLLLEAGEHPPAPVPDPD